MTKVIAKVLTIKSYDDGCQVLGRNDPGNVDDVALDDDVGDNLACQHDDIDDPF